MAKKESIVIRPQAGFQQEFVRSNVDIAFGGGSVGSGKAMSINEIVLTPTGWKTIGSLKVGDIVCSPFSGNSVVVGVYPQSVKPIYRFSTDDGRSCEVSGDHYWSVRTAKQLHKFVATNENKWFSLMTTDEIKERIADNQKTFLPLPDAQEFTEKEYAIPPYVLGVMLGDGCLTDKSWVFDTAFCISNTEQDIINKVALLTETTKVYHQDCNNTKKFYTPHAKQYKDYCLEKGLNTYSYNKYIPEEYLWGSIKQRRALLAGLFDTDGSIGKKNRYSFSTTSRRLRDDFIYLCRSLGYEATYSDDKRAEKYTSGECWRVAIQTDDVIFTSSKHRERYESCMEYLESRKFSKDNRHVTIKSVEYLRDDEAVCIKVDNPYHLFVTRDFMPTHNTFGAVLICAEPSLDPNFRALFLRNNLGDLRSGGGVLDTFREAYGDGVDIVESGEPRVTFKNGARIDVTHVSDQSKEKLLQRFKGRQYDLIYFDELTGFTWECFTTILTRNRGKTAWTGKVRATTNPSYRHWLRKWLDWYIGFDGEIREDRDGKVRYFFMAGETVRDVVWGNSKEEVYKRCKTQIDALVKGQNKKGGNATYETFIKSFVFYSGVMSENKAMMDANGDYVGTVAMMGGRSALQALGNWNVSPEDDIDQAIPQEAAMDCFSNDPKLNGDKWITADLADSGTDNFIAIAWDGFHVIDIVIAGQTTPRTNAELILALAKKHDIPSTHIVYDAIRGTYINDYIPEAQQYVSYRTTLGVYGRNYMRLKDECYARLVEAIKRRDISFADGLAERKYEHANLKEYVSFENEFIDECLAVVFEEGTMGKKQLMSKKKMNQKLGRHRSMDLLDPMAMRMFTVLQYNYGEELTKTRTEAYYDENPYESQRVRGITCDIYDETLFC